MERKIHPKVVCGSWLRDHSCANAMLISKKQASDFIDINRLLFVAFLFLNCLLAVAAQIVTTLDAINFSTRNGNRVHIELKLSGPVTEPVSFSMHNPARIALDFPGVRLNLAEKTRAINIGLTRSVTAVESADRTRVVIKLDRLVPYKIDTSGQSLYITIGESGSTGRIYLPEQANRSRIEDVVFEPGAEGEARVYVVFSDPPSYIDARRENSRIMIEFHNTALSARLDRILDVTDFATPIRTIETLPWGKHTRMIINTTGHYEYLTYQTNKLQTVDVKRGK